MLGLSLGLVSALHLFIFAPRVFKMPSALPSHGEAGVSHP